MSTAPEGAQLSDDGQWWWDGEAWQPVGQPEGSQEVSGDVSGDERAQARAAQGLPQSADDLTDDQRGQLLGEPIVSVDLVDSDQVEVLAMSDSEGDDDGGQYA